MFSYPQMFIGIDKNNMKYVSDTVKIRKYLLNIYSLINFTY